MYWTPSVLYRNATLRESPRGSRKKPNPFRLRHFFHRQFKDSRSVRTYQACAKFAVLCRVVACLRGGHFHPETVTRLTGPCSDCDALCRTFSSTTRFRSGPWPHGLATDAVHSCMCECSAISQYIEVVSTHSGPLAPQNRVQLFIVSYLMYIWLFSCFNIVIYVFLLLSLIVRFIVCFCIHCTFMYSLYVYVSSSFQLALFGYPAWGLCVLFPQL
jgi:hypothetical protein